MVGAADVLEEAGSVARFSGPTSAVELEEEGIDDLAKYRIALHLLQNPWMVADAEVFATTLGFHSVARTVSLLEEMMGDGLLSKFVLPGGVTRYGLAPDSTLRRRLRESCAAEPGSTHYEILVRRLAQRSVARAKRESKRQKAG
jgi:hypothetical protein